MKLYKKSVLTVAMQIKKSVLAAVYKRKKRFIVYVYFAGDSKLGRERPVVFNAKPKTVRLFFQIKNWL